MSGRKPKKSRKAIASDGRQRRMPSENEKGPPWRDVGSSSPLTHVVVLDDLLGSYSEQTGATFG